MEAALVILNYRNYQDTINCIDSVLKYEYNLNPLIVVVDNASNNQSLQRIQEYFVGKTKITFGSPGDKNPEGIVLIQNSINTGYASGNNVGIKYAYSVGAKNIVVLNNDTLLIENSIEIIITEKSKHEGVICAGPILIKKNGDIDYNCAKRRPSFLDIFRLSFFGSWLKTDEWRRSYYYMRNDPKISSTMEVDIISGSCMVFDAMYLEAINFFDEKTFLYYEEAIIHEKARKLGLKFLLVGSTKVIHLGAQSTAKHSMSAFTLGCEYRSLRHYLKVHRGVSRVTASALTFPYWLYLNLYQLKTNLSATKK